MAIKRLLRGLAPPALLSLYHWLMSATAVVLFGNPGSKLTVIGVTGTKGKTSTSVMLWHILQNSGQQCGLISTAQLAIGDKTRLNELKMTMPSRVTMQRLLQRMVKDGCAYAVVETSSEGLAQWRHLGVLYKIGIFTNLAHEHIEAHGSYEKYRAAKAKLAKAAVSHNGIVIVNLDDAEADYFINQAGGHAWGYTFKDNNHAKVSERLAGEIVTATSTKVMFKIGDLAVNLPVGGEFNAYNALAAMAAALRLGISLERSAAVLSTFAGVPGRLEFVQVKPFAVVVDYAHTPESLEAVYKTLKARGRLIAVLGSCGGGRDKAKRAPLGKLAGSYADYVVVTDEDPYDENPRSIMEAVADGVKAAGKKAGENYWIVEDRRAAIRQALALAKENDTVVITGKGAEQWLCAAGGKKIPWDDRVIVKAELDVIRHK